MKLRSLFLATLAAMAMVSCSNENDPIGEGGNKEAEKTAVFNFSIALPNTVATKATTNPGTPEESTVSSITFVLEYTDGTNTPKFTRTYTNIANEFTRESNVYKLKNAELVAPGTATAYVYVNGGEETELTTETGFLTTYAADNQFYMTGKATGIGIEANRMDNNASVTVDRVAVKLEETTDADADTEGRQSKFKAIAKSQENVAELYLDLQNYTFSNLNKKSYALSGTIFAPETPSADTYFNYFVIDNQENQWSQTFSEKRDFSTPITYCFENGTTTPTQVWYQAKVTAKFTENGKEEALSTFFVWENKLYKNFDELNEAFNNSLTTAFGLTEASSNQLFMEKIGAEKYTNGICYYRHNVSEENILRNNWYKLKVTAIKDLGLPELDIPEPGKPTMLTFDVTVNPWTVNENSFEL